MSVSPSISGDDYLDRMVADYLQEYVAQGGSTVKFVVAPEAIRRTFREGLQARASELGYLTATADASEIRISRPEQLFFAISKQLDWIQIGRRFLKRALFPRFDIPNEDLTVEGIARVNDLEHWFVRREIEKLLHEKLLRRKGMSGEFRRAMLNILFSILTPHHTSSATTPFVIEWLRGTLRGFAPVKPALLFRSISRTNGRQMFASLSRWLQDAGMQGLVVIVDIAAVSDARPDAGRLLYTRPGAMDTYEVLRQFIDSIDALDGLALWFLTDANFLDHYRRGMSIYPALEMRLVQDVRDAERPNPFAPLVSLE